MATGTDITERGLAERALRETEDRLTKFMEASAGSVVLHVDGIIIDANPAACRLYGANLPFLIGRSVRDFVTPEHLGDIRLTIARSADPRFQSELIPIRGERLRMGVVRDIRDRREAQARIEELIAGLRAEKDRAEAADRAKSVFLAAANQDLRHPIHAMGLFLNALRSMAQAPT